MSAGSIVIAYAKGGSLHVRRKVVARLESITPLEAVIRCWKGRAPFRRGGVKWSTSARTIPVGDVVREATARETELGFPA
jgi:hypothetical protein